MKILYSIVVVSVLILSGCAQQYSIKNNFDPKEASWIKSKGKGIIEGEAFLKTVGGDVRTCAGNGTTLIPVTSYSTERMLLLYQNVDMGFIPAAFASKTPFSNDDKRYYDYSLSTQCDSTGRFGFEDLPNGNYYAISSVYWKSDPNSLFFEGGLLMQKVKITNGKKIKIIMAY